MKNVSLIKKIEYDNQSNDIYPITFDLGYPEDRQKIKNVYQQMKQELLLSKDYLSLRNNGFTIKTTLDNIPKISELLIENELFFYGVYILYDNFLEMRENVSYEDKS